MKLLFILPEWGEVAGGIATYYRALVPALRRLGHEVHLRVGSAYITAAGNEPADPTVTWLNEQDLERSRSRFRQLAPIGDLQSHLAAAWALRDAASSDRYDLVECVDWGLGFLPWLERDVPVVVRLHASLGQIARREALPGQALFQNVSALLEQATLPLADGLVSYSQANAARWRSRLSRDVACQKPPYLPGEVADRSGRGIVSGKIQRWKGVETLCQAMSKLSDLEIDWYGRDMPTHDGGRLISMSDLLAVKYPEVWGQRVVPQGMVAPEELARRRTRARFAVIPSTWDVFNFTVVEAMGSALPTVVSNGAGAAELVEHGRNGFVFESGCAKALKQCLGALQALSPDQAREMGDAARQTVLSELDPDRAASAHLDYYRQVCRQPARPPIRDLLDRLLGCPQALQDGHQDLLRNLPGRSLLQAVRTRVIERWWRS